MPFFTSSREKNYWLWAFLVFVAIFFTLFLGQPLLNLFSSQDVRALIFVIVMLLIVITIIVHSLKSKPSKIELTILLGIIAVYIMFILRLGMAERSHLMEYSVLAIFIHKAISERVNQEKKIPVPAFLAILITFFIGLLDECIQIFLPDRVFDPNDIVFNGMAAVFAIGSSVFLIWVRKRIQKSKQS